MMMTTATNAVINDWNDRKPRPLSTRRMMSKVEKTTAVLKRAMTEKREMAGQRMVRKTKIPMATASRCDGGQSSKACRDLVKKMRSRGRKGRRSPVSSEARRGPRRGRRLTCAWCSSDSRTCAVAAHVEPLTLFVLTRSVRSRVHRHVVVKKKK